MITLEFVAAAVSSVPLEDSVLQKAGNLDDETLEVTEAIAGVDPIKVRVGIEVVVVVRVVDVTTWVNTKWEPRLRQKLHIQYCNITN